MRILAATNRNLAEMVAAGEFREDLIYRLNVITLTIPPLRDRQDDIVPLAERFLSRFVKDYSTPAKALSDEAREALRSYAWPGNVRELRNVMERASIICPDKLVGANHLGLSGSAATNAPRIGAEMSLEELEKAHIATVLANSETLDQAAKTLGIDASTLYRKRKQLAL